MGIEERRSRERAQRRADILAAAWSVAEEVGYGAFSLEKVAAKAEIGRATVYSYFKALDDLILEMAKAALHDLKEALAQADGVGEALDVPVRLAQNHRSRFDLMFPHSHDPRAHMENEALSLVQAQAREVIGMVERVARSQRSALPLDAKERAAFLAGVSMAGAMVPELQASTTLRHRWQDFCLGDEKSKA